jgi:hypothetical protein
MEETVGKLSHRILEWNQITDPLGGLRSFVSREEDSVLWPFYSPLGIISPGGRCFLGPG